MRLRCLLAVLGLCAIASGAGAEAWWNPAYAYRQRIDIDASMLTEDLVEFPLTFRIEAPGFIRAQSKLEMRDTVLVGGDGQVLASNGSWSESAVLTAKVPLIRAGIAGQHIWLYYGGPEPEYVRETWSAGYLHVNHMSASMQHTINDQAGLQPAIETHDFTGVNFPKDTEKFFTVPAELLAGLGEQFTISVRFRAQLEPGLQTLVSGRRGAEPAEWFNFGLKMPDTVHTNVASDGRLAPELNVGGIRPGEWHSATVRYDARNNSRTICVDGVALQTDQGLPGPLRVTEMRVGRGVLHFEPWQFHGDLAEFRLANVARSDSWMRAEAASLSDVARFAVVGPPQKQGEPAPAPGAFALLSPGKEQTSRSRQGMALSWQMSPGAERYSVFLYESPDTPEPFVVLEAGAATRLQVTREAAGRNAFYWTVLAQSEAGGLMAPERRKLAFYDWAQTGVAPANTVAPALDPAAGRTFDVQGYLRGRIDRATQEFLLETPESSPAILQVLRDRDRTPVREPLVPWAGEFAGKYLTSAQLTWRVTQDPALKARVDSFVQEMIACQGPDGYFGPFSQSARLTGGNWDVWGHYHAMLGLLLYYEDTGYAPALEACTKAADLLFETFGPGGPALTNDGSGGEMNMAVCHGLLLLYRETGTPRYLELAKWIVHEAWNSAGAGRYLESALAGKPLIEFPRHRWESMHDWQALAELYWLTGDAQYRTALEHIWKETLKDVHNTGGVTSGEGFTADPFNTGAIETCCTVAWIAMSVDMLRLTGDSTVADRIEQSTLNSALGAVPYSGRSCAYNVPMDGTRTFGVELHWQAPKGGPDLNCCSVNANRPLGMISEWGLMRDAEGLVVNFYGPGSLGGQLPSGKRVTIAQETEYPLEGAVKLTVTPEVEEEFTLRLRIPEWSRETTVAVNGEAVGGVTPGQYLAVRRVWKAGDVVALQLSMQPYFRDGGGVFAGKRSVSRGPLLLAYDARYEPRDAEQLPVLSDWTSLTFERGAFDGPIAPWLIGTLKDGAGNAFAVCDFSSAGQTGNGYRSWLKIQ